MSEETKPEPQSILSPGEKELIRTQIERDAYKREAREAKRQVKNLRDVSEQKDFTISRYKMVLGNAIELIRKQQRALYGRSSERGKYLEVQTAELFDEAELIACGRVEEEPEPQEEEVPEEKEGNQTEKTRKPRAPYKKQDLCTLPADTPILTVDHTGEVEVPVDPNTGKPMRIVGTRSEKKVGYVRKYVIYRHLFPVFAPCEDYEPEPGEERTVVGYPKRQRLLKGTMVSETVIAEICTGKYLDHIPLHRMSLMHARNGVPISRQDMVHWIRLLSEECEPLMELFREKLFACELINMDETSHRVLREDGEKCTTSHCEVIQVGTCDAYRVVLYTFNVGKSAESLAKLLRGYCGALMTDGLSGYRVLSKKQLEGTHIRKLSCWAHARRGFVELFRINPKSKCRAVILLIKQLYIIETELRKKWAEGKYASKEEFVTERVERTKPIFARIRIWLDVNKKAAVPGSQLDKSIQYCLNRWEELIAYPREFHATPDDNLSEQFTRPFSEGESNWFFSDSVAGAKASSTVYTLAQNAKLTGINERY